jgi:hypothetical protein
MDRMLTICAISGVLLCCMLGAGIVLFVVGLWDLIVLYK